MAFSSYCSELLSEYIHLILTSRINSGWRYPELLRAVTRKRHYCWLQLLNVFQQQVGLYKMSEITSNNVEHGSSSKSKISTNSDDSICDTKSHHSDDEEEEVEEWPDVPMPGTWGTYELEENPWDDRKRPVVRLFSYEDLTLTDQEKEGILTERIVAACSSYLDRCPETGRYVLCKCCLQQKGLVDISILTYHHYLQYLDLSHNQLTDLSPLGEMPFLMYLDVSDNLLMELLNFKAPFNLTYVDYSYNKVFDIGNLSAFWSIVHLNLSHNEIFVIRGLDKLSYLQNLDLSYNSISCIENMNDMNLVTLNLENNYVTSFELGEDVGLKTLRFLKTINLSHNCLTTLKLFVNVKSVRQIIMESNQLDDLLQLTYLRNLRFLTDVNFRNNQMCLVDKYLETCIHIIKPIRIVDGQRITADEKVAIRNKHGPTPEVQAADKHSKLLLLEQLNNFYISPTILPVDENIPCILALVGPPESKHDKLAADFCKSHSRYVELGVNHTTRPKLDEEIEGETYHFVSDAEFKELIREGTFISVAEHFGHSYGLSENEIVKVMNRKHVLVTHTNLVGAINMKLANLNVKLVLTMPSEDKEHCKNLIEKYYFDHKISRQMNLIKITNNYQEGKSSIEQWCSCDSDVFPEITNILANILGYTNEMEMKYARQISIKFLDTVKTRVDTNPHLDDSITYDLSTSTEATEKRSDLTSERFRSISEVEFEEETCLSVLSEPLLDDFGSLEPERKLTPNEEIQRIYREIVELGRMYVEFHRANPGFFCQTVYTDKEDDAMIKLESILKEVVTNPKKTLHAYNYDTDPAYNDMIDERLKRLNEEIRWDMDLSLEKPLIIENGEE